MSSKKVNKELKRLAQESAKFRPKNAAHIERTSAQVAQQSQRLAAKVLRSGALTSKNRGHLLLASKGIDTDGMARSLAAIQVKAAALEPIEPLRSTDVEGFLRHQHELILLTAIEEAKKETLRSYQDNYRSYLRGEWTRTKQELLEGLGQSDGSLRSGVPGDDTIVFTPTRPTTGGRQTPGGRAVTASPSSTLLIDDTVLATGSSSSSSSSSSGRRGGAARPLHMTGQMMHYAQVVVSINAAALRGKPFAVLTSGQADSGEPAGFLAAVQKMHAAKELRDSWRMMRSLLGDGMITPGFVEEPERLRWRLVLGARRFLEEQYTLHINAVIAQQIRDAKLGGDMSMRRRIAVYLRIKHVTRPPPAGTDRRWQEIFVALRCGDRDTAVQAASELPLDFARHLKSFLADGCLHEPQWSQFIQQYQPSGDPYHLAVCNIVAKCDLEQTAIKKIFETTDDFLWYALMLLRPAGSGPLPAHLAKNDYPLAKLQQTIRQYPASYFNPRGDQPFAYFQVLMLSQLFADAVGYLLNTAHAVDAAHFAIVLHEFNLLPPDLTAKILRQYVRPIGQSDPKVVISYLQLIKDRAARMRAITDFVLEIRDYDALVGVILPNGQHKGGCLSQLMPKAEVQEIISLAASDAEQQGKFMDALRLYDLCEDYEHVVMLLNQLLSEQLTRSNPPVSKVAAAIARKYHTLQILQEHVSPALAIAFEQLQQLERFFGFYRQREYDAAHDTLYRLNLVPATREQIKPLSENFRHLEEPVKRNFAEILLAAMNILKHFYEQRAAARPLVKEQAQALMTFVGTIPYSVPADVYSALARINCLMG